MSFKEDLQSASCPYTEMSWSSTDLLQRSISAHLTGNTPTSYDFGWLKTTQWGLLRNEQKTCHSIMSCMFSPLFPHRGPVLTTLSPSKPWNAMAISRHCSPSHSHGQPCKPQESQLERLSGRKMTLLLFLHLLKSLPPTFGSCLLNFSLAPCPLRI